MGLGMGTETAVASEDWSPTLWLITSVLLSLVPRLLHGEGGLVPLLYQTCSTASISGSVHVVCWQCN